MNLIYSRQKYLPGILAALCLAVVPAGGAVAQNERVTALEEVIVTARKREESLQDAPLAVTALSSDVLEARGLNNLADLGAGAVPTLKAQPYPNSPATLIIGMRGVGVADAGAVTTEIPVGIYIDGVYLGRAQGLAADILDVERVEILRGPQSSLYGRNTVGGAVNFISRKPSGEFGFSQKLSWGDKWGERRSVTHLDIPAIGAVSARFSILDATDDGWVRNTREGANSFNYGYEDKEGYRLALQWQIGNTTFDYSYDDSDTAVTQSFYQVSSVSGPNGFGVTPEGLRALNIAAGNVGNPNPVPGGASLADIVRAIQEEGREGGTDSPYVERWVVPGDSRLTRTPVGRYVRPTTVETKGHNLTIEGEINEHFSIKYIGSYREVAQLTATAYGGGLLGGAGLTNGPISGPIDQDQTTHELQFIGDALDGRLSYVAGLYYFKENITEKGGALHVAYESFANSPEYQGLLGATIGRVRALGAALAPLGADPANPDLTMVPAVLAALAPLGFNNPATAIQLAGGEAGALGAQLGGLGFLLGATTIPGFGLTGITALGPDGLPQPYDTPQLLAAGDPDFRDIIAVEAESYAGFGQFTYSLTEKLNLTVGGRYTEDERTGLRTLSGNQVDNTFRKVDGDNFDYSITLDYDLGDLALLEDAIVYARWATGYKSGGIGRRSADFGTYGAETIESAEVGIKTDFWGKRGRLNLAIFTSDYEDRQTTFQDRDGNVTRTLTENADGIISIDGLELEITLIPIDGLVLDLSYNYLDWDFPTQRQVQFETLCAPVTGLASPTDRVEPTNGVCPTATPILFQQAIPQRDASGNVVTDADGNLVAALLPFEFHIPQAPEHSYSLSASYTLAPFSFGTLTARLDYIYSDDYSYSPIIPVSDDSERSVLNGRLTLSEIPLFSNQGSSLRVSLWGRNLADEEYIIYRSDRTSQLGSFVSEVYGEPRSAGIEMVYEYR